MPLFALQLIRNRRRCSNDGAYLQFIWLIYLLLTKGVKIWNYVIFSYIEGCLLVLIFNTCLIVFMNYKKFMGIIGFSP